MATNKNSISGYIDSVGKMFAKLPAMPKGGRDFIVMIVPWLALIFGILGLLGSISAFRLFTYFPPMVYWGGTARLAGTGIIVLILGIISSVLLLMAFSGTKNKKEKGWRFLYYSEIVALVSSVITVSPGGILVALVGFYLLYQIRSYYK